MSAQLYPVHPVERLGDAILFRGPAVRDLAYLLPRAVVDAARRDGITPPRRWRQILETVQETARAMSACPATDVRSDADPPLSMTTREVAELLGIDERSVRRLGSKVGGRKVRNEWIFDRSDVEAEARRRQEAAA